MPIDALRSCADQFDDILRAVSPKRLVRELAIADKAFHFKYFKGYRPDTIGRGRIRKIANKEILQGEGHELLANLIIVHWNERKARLYREMVEHVKTINEDVEAIERIADDKATSIVEDLLKRHSRVDILLCVRLNGVRFSDAFVDWRLVQGNDEPLPAAEEDDDEGADDEASAAPEEASAAPEDAPAEDETAAATEAAPAEDKDAK